MTASSSVGRLVDQDAHREDQLELRRPRTGARGPSRERGVDPGERSRIDLERLLVDVDAGDVLDAGIASAIQTQVAADVAADLEYAGGFSSSELLDPELLAATVGVDVAFDVLVAEISRPEVFEALGRLDSDMRPGG